MGGIKLIPLGGAQAELFLFMMFSYLWYLGPVFFLCPF